MQILFAKGIIAIQNSTNSIQKKTLSPLLSQYLTLLFLRLLVGCLFYDTAVLFLLMFTVITADEQCTHSTVVLYCCKLPGHSLCLCVCEVCLFLINMWAFFAYSVWYTFVCYSCYNFSQLIIYHLFDYSVFETWFFWYSNEYDYSTLYSIIYLFILKMFIYLIFNTYTFTHIHRVDNLNSVLKPFPGQLRRTYVTSMPLASLALT